MDTTDDQAPKLNFTCTDDPHPIDAHQWPRYDVNRLYEDLITLNQRLAIVEGMGKPSLVKQLKGAISQLQSTIASYPTPKDYV
jgi:hypothetical protein